MIAAQLKLLPRNDFADAMSLDRKPLVLSTVPAFSRTNI
jgi:hypothetical protein